MIKQHCGISAGFVELLAAFLKADCAGLLAQCFKGYPMMVQHTLQLSDSLSETEWTPAVPA